MFKSGDFKALFTLADVTEFIEILFFTCGHHSFEHVFPFSLRPNSIYEPIDRSKGSVQRIFENI